MKRNIEIIERFILSDVSFNVKVNRQKMSLIITHYIIETTLYQR